MIPKIYTIQRNFEFTIRPCFTLINRPDTPRRLPAGGLRIFWLNHWQMQTKFPKKCKKKFFLKILSGFASDFSQNIRRPPAEGLRGVFGQIPLGQHCWSIRYVPSLHSLFSKLIIFLTAQPHLSADVICESTLSYLKSRVTRKP